MENIFEELIKIEESKPRCNYPLTKNTCRIVVEKEGDRCKQHKDKKEKRPCLKCGKLTASYVQYCHEHILKANR